MRGARRWAARRDFYDIDLRARSLGIPDLWAPPALGDPAVFPGAGGRMAGAPLPGVASVGVVHVCGRRVGPAGPRLCVSFPPGIPRCPKVVPHRLKK